MERVLAAACKKRKSNHHRGRKLINRVKMLLHLRVRHDTYAELEKTLGQVRKMLAAMVRDFSAAPAVFSVRQVETVESLPNLPKIAKNVLQIDVRAADRMLDALNAINGIDFMLILGWAATKAQATNSAASAFLGSEQKRADFGEMMFEFERVLLVQGMFISVVNELRGRHSVGPSC